MHLYIIYRYSKDVRVLIRGICPASNNRYDMVCFNFIILISFTYRQTKKRGLLFCKSAIEVVGGPCHRKYLQKPTRVYRTPCTPIGTRKCGYTHEHLLILLSNDILKFPTFQ